MNVLEKILEEIENLGYYPEGMGCGIEDRGITDRYEACEYGWNEAIEAVVEVINNMDDVPALMSGEWIPVSERLPEEGKDCIVTVRYTGFMGMHGLWVKTGHLKNGEWWGDCMCGEVIAWQPSPEPYKEEEV